MRKQPALVTFGLALLVVGLALWQLQGGGRYPTDGPLPVSGGVAVTFEAAVGKAVSWGMPLDGSEHGVAIVQRIEPEGVEGLDLLGVRLCHSSPEPRADGTYLNCAPVSSHSWPPEGVTTAEVEGTVLEGHLIGLLIGVRRQPVAPEGTISSVRIVYTVDGVTYETVEPWSLRLVPQGALPSG